MNASLVSGHLLGSVVGTIVWEVAIHLPTDQPGNALVMAGVVGPATFAAASLGLIALGERSKRAAAPVPAPRREVPAAAVRRELDARRRELTR